MTFFQLSFIKCSGTDSKGNVWKSESVINTALDTAALKVAMVNTYYDFDDYSNPIKTYLDDSYYYEFVSGYQKNADIYISRKIQ